MDSISTLLLTFSALLAAGGQLLLKVGATGRDDLAAFINVSILGGLLLYGISTLIWIYVLSKENLVNVFAFTALTFVLVYVGGVFILGEKISSGGIFGILLILSGLYLITSHGT